MADEDTATQLDETALIRAHKLARLRELGYQEPEARWLAEGDIDVHAVRDLIEHGCDLPTAARIAR